MNVKRTVSFGALVALLFAMVISAVPVRAAGIVLLPNTRLTANKSSAVANNSDTIAITANLFLYECNKVDSYDGKHYIYDSVEDCNTYGDGVKGETSYTGTVPSEMPITLSVEGEGVSLSKNTINQNGDTITVTSSASGSKNIKSTLTWTYKGTTRTSNTVTLNFTTPPASTPAPAKPKAAPTPTPVVEKPATPTVATILVDDKPVTAGQEVSLTTNQPLVLAGKTVPGGKVSVYVFSEPKLYETTADKDGNWSVKVEGLPEGSHHAEVEVLNPANNQKSDRTKLMDFKVVADKKPIPKTVASIPKKTESSKTGIWIGLLAAVLIIAAIAGFLLWKRKQKTRAAAGPTDTSFTPPSSSSDSAGPQPIA